MTASRSSSLCIQIGVTNIILGWQPNCYPMSNRDADDDVDSSSDGSYCSSDASYLEPDCIGGSSTPVANDGQQSDITIQEAAEQLKVYIEEGANCSLPVYDGHVSVPGSTVDYDRNEVMLQGRLDIDRVTGVVPLQKLAHVINCPMDGEIPMCMVPTRIARKNVIQPGVNKFSSSAARAPAPVWRQEDRYEGPKRYFQLSHFKHVILFKIRAPHLGVLACAMHLPAIMISNKRSGEYYMNEYYLLFNFRDPYP